VSKEIMEEHSVQISFAFATDVTGVAPYEAKISKTILNGSIRIIKGPGEVYS
jgi:hypothetical protein